jgi:hypothetical protein
VGDVDTCSLILIPPEVSLQISWFSLMESGWQWLFACLPESSALAPVEGSLSASPSGGWVEIGMSPSKPGVGKMKLSKACIQTIKV